MNILHPGIRVLCFLIVATALSLHSSLLYLFAPPLLALLPRTTWRGAWPLVRGLRWFFVSLLLLSLLLPSAETNWQGVLFAVERIAVLVVIVLLAHGVLNQSSSEELVAALDWLFSPLTRLGVPLTRFSVRLSLVLATVQKVQVIYELPQVAPNTPPWQVWRTRLRSWFALALAQAEQAELVPMTLPELPAPARWQWLLPLGLGGVVVGAVAL